MSAKTTSQVEHFFANQIEKRIGRKVPVTIELIPVEQLSKIRTKYERDIQESILAKIRKEFNPLVASLLLVNVRPDGEMIRCDGNHRITIIKEDGEKVWGCLVSHGMLEDEEAKMWRSSCVGRGMARPEEILQAGVVAGDRGDIEIINSLHHFGFKSPHRIYRNRKGTTIKAIGVIRTAAACGILDMLLEIISQAWPGDEFAVNGNILRGLITFLRFKKVRENLDKERLIAVLSDPRKGNPRRILGDSESGTKGYVYVAVANEMKELYNYNLRGAARIDHDFKPRENRSNGTMKI